MQIIGRRLMQVLVVSNSDRVISEYPLPNGCSLNSVFLNCHIIGAEDITITDAVAYGISGFVIPVIDPDAATGVDTIWDRQVPKDIDEGAGVFDLDTVATDAQPEFEIGEFNPQSIFGLAGNQPLEIFRRRKMWTIASQRATFTQKDAASDIWVPMDHFVTTVKKTVRPSVHSHVAFGFSSPELNRTSNALVASLAENEWAWMTYLETFLSDAAKYLMGVFEAGAESPYEELSTFVAHLLEEYAYEETAALFQTQAYNVFCQSTYSVTVPGTFAVGTLTSE